MTHSKPEPILFLSDARGVFIPRDFANEVKSECVSGVRAELWDAISNPDCEWYWDAWNEVCDSAVITAPDTGVRYTVYQNGDCWLIPEGMEWDEENEFYKWPSDESDD